MSRAILWGDAALHPAQAVLVEHLGLPPAPVFSESVFVRQDSTVSEPDRVAATENHQRLQPLVHAQSIGVERDRDQKAEGQGV